MLYLCEVTSTNDPLGIGRVKAYILSEGGLGESEWMFRVTPKHPEHMTNPDYKEYPDFPTPRSGDLVWASLVNAERNVFAWHSIVPAEEAAATKNAYEDILDTNS